MNHEMNHEMNKEAIRDFFDKCAPGWDADMIRNEEVIAKILDNAGIKPGIRVLDVACGTGVLFPDYLSRDVAGVTAVDISPEMVRIAKENCDDPKVEIICADIEEYDGVDECTGTGEEGGGFDVCMVYNAFPHFPDPEELIKTLAAKVKPGGRLSIAHSMSRAKLEEHHKGCAAHVSLSLPEADELARMMEDYFDVDCVISDDVMYQVAGTRR
ncbi:MAG: class I SAM-dependent methyltransferase [Bacillota bacterium]|nr:class I SAM-dependent methyltransferase [Bacillota bacterium]